MLRVTGGAGLKGSMILAASHDGRAASAQTRN